VSKKKLGNTALYYATSVLYITPSPTFALFTTSFYVNRGKFEHMKKLTYEQSCGT